MDTRNLGRALRAFRESYDFTLREASKILGMSAVELCNYELGEMDLTSEMAIKIADTIQEAKHKRDGTKESPSVKESVRFILKAREQFAAKSKLKEDKHGVIECPKCNGKLHMRQSAYNGHVWGQCETEGCLQWME